MIQYAGSFTAGFEKIIPSLLKEAVPDSTIERLESALVIFSSAVILEENSLPFCNNLFVCLKIWNTNTLYFSEMKNTVPFNSLKPLISPFLKGKKTFRLRFSKENQFCSVDKNLVTSLEKSVTNLTGLVPDRLNAKTELHLLIRRENISMFALKLTEKGSTEKIYEQGELRSETVRLMLFLAEITDEDYIFCDPFAGHGSIPRHIALLHPNTHCFINDNNKVLVSKLEKEFKDSTVSTISCSDACSLVHIEKNSVNVIITDPPWGCFDASLTKEKLADFYKAMLTEFERILAQDGRAVVLTGAKGEFEAAVFSSACFTKSMKMKNFRTDILINGKKAAVYCISKDYS